MISQENNLKEVKHTIRYTKETMGGREGLYSILPKNGVVAEIGVEAGVNALDILRYNQPSKLHLIDTWKDKVNKDLLDEKVKPLFKDNQVVEIHRTCGLEKVKDFEDDYFDWIYIDSEKSFEHTVAEIKAYIPKVKKGGYICGHDYIRTDLSEEHIKKSIPKQIDFRKKIWIDGEIKRNVAFSILGMINKHRNTRRLNTKHPVDWCVENLPLEFTYLTHEFEGCGWLSYGLKVLKDD
jgi:predicted O-methyltransferase YrrM